METVRQQIKKLGEANREKNTVRHALSDEAENAKVRADRDYTGTFPEPLRHFYRTYELLLRQMASMLWRQTPENNLELNLHEFRAIAQRLVVALEYPAKDEDAPAKKRKTKKIKVPAKPVRKLNKALKSKKK